MQYVHAEVSKRTGPFFRYYIMPTWLEEGLGMQVDYRSDYSIDKLSLYNQKFYNQKFSLNNIKRRDFFAQGDRGKYHYALSKCVVERWISQSRQSNNNVISNFLDNAGWIEGVNIEPIKKHLELCHTL